MKLYDTHCHLNSDKLYPDIETWISHAKKMGVVAMNVIGWDESSSQLAITIAKQYPMCHAVVGLHPVNDDLANPHRLDWLKPLASSSTVVAIGEIGLDYYWKKDILDQNNQKKVFIQQIQLANEVKLPIIVHCREAYEDTLTILKAHKPLFGGVMHCYAGPISLVQEFIDVGMMISIGGPITYKKNDDLRTIVKTINLEKLLIETDAPYLSPEPLRGKINTPGNVTYVFEEVVKHRKEHREQVEKKILGNSEKIFHVKTNE